MMLSDVLPVSSKLVSDLIISVAVVKPSLLDRPNDCSVTIDAIERLM